MNLKHGFYSTNTSINPDSVMLSNIEIKKLLISFERDIVDVAKGNIVRTGITDLAVRLIDCALPHSKHLLPKKDREAVIAYYQSRTFEVLRNSIKDKTTTALVESVNQF